MTLTDRYASAVRSSNLRSSPDTVQSDSDVLGAAGLAAKKHGLAIALLRLLSGDNHSSREIVEIMGGMIDGKAFRVGVEMTRVEAEDIGRAVLAWYRHGACHHCGGLGYERVEGAPTLSGHHCKRCNGTGKRPFDREFSAMNLDLARWMLAQIEREIAIAGSAAMKALAPKLDL